MFKPHATERRIAGLVAGLAREWESGCRVVRRRRGLIGGKVTAGACDVALLEDTVAVTRRALDLPVGTVERQRRHRSVVPPDISPVRGAMTLLALATQLQPVAVILPTFPVTVETGRRRAFVDLVQMARRTLDRAVPSVEGKRRGVVELPIRRRELG